MDTPQKICLSHFSLIAFLVLTFATILLPDDVSASYGGNETDYLALLNFKSMINQDPYEILTSWNNSSHFCNWSGVSCEKHHNHKRVTILNLISQGLKGSLSPYVGNLTFLHELWLWNNSFEGTIPHEIGRLSRLRFLYLNQNKFSGTIPTNMSGCYNLEEFQLGSNKLVGNIPNEISFLSKLTLFAVDDNMLTGGIPPFVSNLTLMKVFSLELNPLGGNIPDVFGRLKSLTEIYTRDCNLSGTIPNSIYNNSFLTVLTMSNNQLHGSLPIAIGALLPHLVNLQLKNNQLVGILPPSISNCSKLRYLEMDNNNFTGKLTIDFSKLRDINRVLLQHNQLGSREADEMKFIDSLTNCTKLQYLGLGNNMFKGMLPKSVSNLSYQLQTLNLGSNKLYGKIPLSISNLGGLIAISLVENQLTGNIPSSIGMLQNLQAAFLYENQFSGFIPDTLGNLSKLVILSLRANKLEGDIPSSLGNFHQLQKLELSNNKLSGEIPKQILQLPSLSVLLNLSRNNLLGSLPMEVGGIKILSNLDLSYNKLSGNIPSSLGGCASLSFLSLKGNLFQGVIPPSLSSLRGVMKLDLSHNNFSGQIPRFLERFSLQQIDLSFNDFEGEVPTLGVFANASAFSILGNARLCGGLMELGLPKCEEIKKHEKKFPVFVIVVMIATASFTILCLVYAWCKKKIKRHSSQSSINEMFLKVSYNQLLKATDGFSEDNLIGKGGFSYVYKGILDVGDDKFVAIKVLRLQNRGAHKSFTAECEAWRRIRHRNLLKIITSCSSIDFQGNDFKALIYEFMPNGNLHEWLHSSSSTIKLNLLQRLNILIDVALALDYLHNHSSTTIVHGDLKPSNILLDKDMVAHVGDFGLTRFFGTNLDQNNSSTGTTGTIGYAPPEYGLGSEMTSNGDVYSYGILLLEVMTGKKPTDDVFTEGLSLHKFATMGLRDHVRDVIDGDAIVLQSTEANVAKMDKCLASIVKIGVSCSMDSPSLRLNMKFVVHELQHIMDAIQSISLCASTASLDECESTC